MTCDQQHSALRSLVVEDHLVSRRYITEALRRCGWTVKHCRSAEEALKLYSAWNPQLVISDLRLPGADGLELAEALDQRNAPGNHKTLMLLVTAQTSPALEKQARAAGFTGVLRKPLKFAALRKVLSELKAGKVPRVNDKRQFAAYRDESDPRSTAGLLNLFRAELSQRLPELESLLLDGCLAEAEAVIHQLTASAAICDNRALELRLRDVNAACRQPVDVPRLARSFARFHRCARYVLQ